MIERWRTALTASVLGAVEACGPATPRTTPISVLTAEPLASARYAAVVAPKDDRSGRGPDFFLENGEYKCADLVQSEHPDAPQESASCPEELARTIRQASELSLVVVDGAGARAIPAAEVQSFLGEIDSPAKALLVAYFHPKYDLYWDEGDRSVGSLRGGYARPVEGGFEVLGGMTEHEGPDCGSKDVREIVRSYQVVLLVRRDGSVELKDKTQTSTHEVSDPCHPHGRRPQGFVDVATRGTVRGHLARAMHHEAESVRAFSRLARELERHNAPGAMVRAARSAAGDERRHARMFARLLGKAGAGPRIRRDRLPCRSIEEVAVENAAEGCVMETFAAAVAVHQSRHASLSSLRAHYAGIAADELGHAALAHALDAWLSQRLSRSARDRVHEARDAARAQLAGSFRDPASLAEILLGLPWAAGARRLLDACEPWRSLPGEGRSRGGP